MPSSTDRRALERRRVEDREVGRGVILTRHIGSARIRRGRSSIFSVSEPRRGVVRAQHRQPRARVARRDAGQQRAGSSRAISGCTGCARHVDHVRARVTEPDQQEEQPLLVVARAGELGELARCRASATGRRRTCRGSSLLHRRARATLPRASASGARRPPAPGRARGLRETEASGSTRRQTAGAPRLDVLVHPEEVRVVLRLHDARRA